jgi:hypothetical protein
LAIAEPYINQDKSIGIIYNGKVIFVPTSVVLEKLGLSALKDVSVLEDPNYIYLTQKGEAREFRMEFIFGVAFVAGLIGIFVFHRAFRA